MLQYIIPAMKMLFTVENFIWINLGVFIGSVFAAIPGLTVILCIILFLPFTYKMTAIPGMMFLLGIYCAGGYGGSVSAILINTPGTPHAATTMLDGHPMSEKGRTKAALKIALYASTFGGIFSALTLLFLAPQVAKVAANIGTAEYFLVCVFGLTIIAGISGKSMIKGIISACLGLFISCIGADPQTSYDRFTFGISRLYLGLDLAICLIGLFALIEILKKAELKPDRLKLDTSKIMDDGKITKDEYKRSCHDAATHVPLVIAGGAFQGGKEITELVSTESLPKTILAIAGVDVGDAMIGENLLDVVQGKTDNRANEVYSQISESRVGRSIRTADYMYAVYAPGKNGGEYASADLYADDFLYDLKKDPYELTNLIHDHAYDSVRLKMREKLLAWIEKAEHTQPVIVDQA